MPLTYIYILLGGLASGDGYADSPGMYVLAARLRHIPQAHVRVLTWGKYPRVVADIAKHPNGKHIVIGYSGGGSRATWLSRMQPRPPIDLMVLYDPSPRWQMQPIPCTVKQTVSYTNLHPRFAGLGGGVAKGCHVERVNISMNHARVQLNGKLHQRTIAMVTEVAGQ